MGKEKKKEQNNYRIKRPHKLQNNEYELSYTYSCLTTIIVYFHLIIENNLILIITRKVFMGYENFINWTAYLIVLFILTLVASIFSKKYCIALKNFTDAHDLIYAFLIIFQLSFLIITNVSNSIHIIISKARIVVFEWYYLTSWHHTLIMIFVIMNMLFIYVNQVEILIRCRSKLDYNEKFLKKHLNKLAVAFLINLTVCLTYLIYSFWPFEIIFYLGIYILVTIYFPISFFKRLRCENSLKMSAYSILIDRLSFFFVIINRILMEYIIYDLGLSELTRFMLFNRNFYSDKSFK